MKKLILLILLSLLPLQACTKRAAVSDPSSVTIGTFNIEWLGDAVDDRVPRSVKDYELIAEFIQRSGADIMGLQEIENEKALEIVLRFLPGWSYKLGSNGGKQNLGVIYKEDIEIESLGEYMSVSVVENKTRPGFIVKAKKGNFDWIMMVVHFKSTSRYDDTPEKKLESYRIRSDQAEVVDNWVDSVLAAGSEDDVIIVGDFNDNPVREKTHTLDSLVFNEHLNFVTTDLKSCKYRFWKVIDHIVISDAAQKRMIKDSEKVMDIYSALPKSQAEKVSDHCPVAAKFDTKMPDND